MNNKEFHDIATKVVYVMARYADHTGHCLFVLKNGRTKLLPNIDTRYDHWKISPVANMGPFTGKQFERQTIVDPDGNEAIFYLEEFDLPPLKLSFGVEL